MKLPVIELKAKRNSLHPWIFERMVRHPRPAMAAGTLVEVKGKDGEFIGRGIYNGTSQISLRLLTQNRAQELDQRFFRAALERALAFRRDTLRLSESTDAFRWVHGEADGLSGLIVDRYADVCVVQPFSAGWSGQTLDWIVEGLQALAPGSRIALRPELRAADREGLDYAAELSRYPGPENVEVQEHGLRVNVDLRAGHKTGFFLDQRENRQRLATLARGKKVLDCFCYTGGFSLAAMRAGAASATAVDLDDAALAVGRANAERNDVAVEFVQANVFDHLRKVVVSSERPDVLILDPSKLAGVKDELPRAMRMYGDLNRLAMQAVAPGGVLLTCSCSGLVSEPEFLSILTRAAIEANATFQVFAIAGAAADHPWSTLFPEGRYLKAVYARVVK